MGKLRLFYFTLQFHSRVNYDDPTSCFKNDPCSSNCARYFNRRACVYFAAAVQVCAFNTNERNACCAGLLWGDGVELFFAYAPQP